MTADSPALTVRRELQRKAIHGATTVLPVAYAAGIRRPVMVGLTGALLATAIAVELARRWSPAVRERFDRLAGPLLRTHEAGGGVAGATWLFAAFFLVCLLTPPSVAVAAMWAVSAGDGAAGTIGRLVGRHRWASGKSLEGSVALLAMTAAGAWGLANWSPMTALGLGLAGALSEAPAGPLDDNLRTAGGVALTGILIITLTH